MRACRSMPHARGVRVLCAACVHAHTCALHCRGFTLENTRFNAAEKTIGPDNVHRLAPAWNFTTAGDVSATPTVVGGRLYVPDWNGNLYCLNATTGVYARTTCMLHV